MDKKILPVGEWMSVDDDTKLGRNYRVVLTDSIEPLSLAPFTRHFGWKLKEFQSFIETVKLEVRDAAIHAYNHL